MTTAIDPTIIAFTIAAIGLLGSPGPAIAALLAVGKVHGLGPGLRFYGGLQVGLATAAAVSAAGFVSVVQTLPVLRGLMVIVACAYLIYLAYKIATAAVGTNADPVPVASDKGLVLAGATLGLTNPKAYVAFAALMAPVNLMPASAVADAVLKWGLVVAVMVVVDIVWLLVGVALGRAHMPKKVERVSNWVLAAMIVLAGLTLL